LKASLLGLSLDDHVHTIDPTSLTRSSNPVRQAEYDSLLHAIRGTQKNVSNRFFDKPLTIIVDPAARAGAMGEHAPVDALVPSMVAEYALEKSVDVSAFVSTEKEKEILPTHFSFLDWQVPNKMWEEFVNAQLRADRILADSDDSVLWFESYGVDWIQENSMCDILCITSPKKKQTNQVVF
jgi:carnitine O-acetyltransferase